MVVFLLLLCFLMTFCLICPKESVSENLDKGKESVFVKGVWISYFEFAEMINGKTYEQYQDEVKKVFGNLLDMGLNTVFLHVRSHSDSFYPSSIFPWSVLINDGKGVDYDPLSWFVQQAHACGVAVHAWVNPYRISSQSLNGLLQNNPAYGWKSDSNKVVETGQGVYYNPSSPMVRQLILSGIREILENYDIDGIQYDDYFYPTTDTSFDEVAYKQYCDGTEKPMSQSDWRRCQVNLLVSGTHQLVEQYDGVVFGISPSADIQKNYDSYYADVVAWVAGEYVDYLCPQLYFGFDYPDQAFGFEKLLSDWKGVSETIPLYIGLASYKVGQTDAGSNEWVTATDLLARQTDCAVNLSADGIVFYRYTSLFKTDSVSVAQRENLKKVLADL
jgi:uncharacterized lipoprotein YddW (UPF0748 family)